MRGGTEERRINMKILLGALIGGIIGFAVGYFGKCSSGACPLTRNPIVSASIGALLGAFIAAGR